MCESLAAVDTALGQAGLELRVIGIGDAGAARRFSRFTGLSLENLRVVSDSTLHSALGLHAGPGLAVPDAFSEGLMRFLLSTLPGGAPADSAQLRPVFNAWLNYLAMCAGIGAPGTLQEIFRGYVGDRSAPERFGSDDVVTVGPIQVGPGVGPVKLGPISYSSWWGDEAGYQRPIELATVRLKNMVEVLSNWESYVSNPVAIAQRGATFVFDADGDALYEYRHRGVLTYSETMPRPLSFLAPFIGEEAALNPLGLGDASAGGAPGAVPGRGVLKPAGKVMSLLAPVFKLENELQARVLGGDAAERAEARKEIEEAVRANPVVVYTYGLSPFSSEALAVLDAAGARYERIELGPEWFLLGRRASVLRAELLAMTGQSSLPHVFIGGSHVGGLFTGTDEGTAPGVAALQEAGELARLIELASEAPLSAAVSLSGATGAGDEE